MRITVTVIVTAVLLLGFPGVAAAAPKPFCEKLKGINTGQTCQILISDPAYIVSITLPSFYPDQKSLEEYITKTRDDFLSVAKSSGSPDAPYGLDITSTNYESAIPPRGTQSLVLKVVENVGSGPTTRYQAFNWDQGFRKPITWETLWRPDTDPLQVIFPIVRSELQKQTEQPVSIAPNVGLDPVNYQNFAITNDEITFFFSPDELLPGAAGTTQAPVPRSAVDAMLA